MKEIVISSKSWHYRLYKFLRSKLEDKYSWSPPLTLCGYTWGFVWTVFLSFVIVAIILALTGVLAVGPFIAAWSYFMNHSAVAGRALAAYSFIYGSCLVGGGTCFLIAYSQDAMSERRYEKLFHKPGDDGALTTLGILVEIGKSFKKKYCPIIQYKG